MRQGNALICRDPRAHADVRAMLADSTDGYRQGMTNQPDDVRTGSLTGDDSETAPGLSPGHTVAHEPERRHDGVEHGPTRIGAVWVATGVALLLAVLLLVFILQNQQQARIDFLGFSGEAPLGVALLVAAVAGGLLVGIAGAARVAQLRHRVKRAQRAG